MRYGWNDDVFDAFSPHAGRGLVPGRVVRVDRGGCRLITDRGPVRVEHADTPGAADPGAVTDPAERPCPGDWAVLAPLPDSRWRLHTVLPRRTALLRSGAGRRSGAQVLAANVDRVVITVSLHAEPVPARTERLVSLAWAAGAQPIVVLTKADLAPAADQSMVDTATVVPGTPVLALSSRTGEGVEALADRLTGLTSVILGPSGTGKSTLVNALLGREEQRVSRIRETDGRGRHTTTARDLLPLPGGGVLIDTPGVRGVGMWGAREGIRRTFTDVEERAAECRFADCSHTAEPGCAVLAAVESGELPERRLSGYRKLLREEAWEASRSDARLRADQRREFKQRHREMEDRMARKYGPGGRADRR
ncbi:ribosome small subunit-dependent GTPase A [Streptomyces sp. ST2-7A]|uniref:ribosome small subunit-dependent GTPase A n=1 Tax=Streptomyces sp. ST2-7A TaxID=2907214 RepID=UPI001F3D6951|nr:ribosome small subunit-dependent GTPase A [Streptomyces sp. ST2-7A]MCE7082304.1 ribosome small subunit-dependent GTPase A [Streptomyces sp. ST2-7A]